MRSSPALPMAKKTELAHRRSEEDRSHIRRREPGAAQAKEKTRLRGSSQALTMGQETPVGLASKMKKPA